MLTWRFNSSVAANFALVARDTPEEMLAVLRGPVCITPGGAFQWGDSIAEVGYAASELVTPADLRVNAKECGEVEMDERIHPSFGKPSGGPVDSEPFVMVFIADPQFGMVGGAASWQPESSAFSRIVDIVNAMAPRPRFCAVLGDLVHHMPDIYRDAVNDCESVFHRQIASFKECLACVNPAIPVVLTPGNHDVGNTPTPSSISVYKEAFGLDYFQFQTGGLQVIALNSALTCDPSEAQTEAGAQEEWLKRALRDDKAGACQMRVILQHHPLWLDRADEPDQLLSQSHIRGVTVPNDYFHIPLVRRTPLLQMLQNAENVDSVFTGHFHQNRVTASGQKPQDIRMIVSASASENLAPVVNGKCMPVVDEPGFRVAKFFPATQGTPALLVSRYFSTASFGQALDTLPVPLNPNDPEDWSGFC